MHAVCSKKVISLTLLSLTSDHVMHHVCEEMVHQGKTLYHGGSTKRGPYRTVELTYHLSTLTIDLYKLVVKIIMNFWSLYSLC